MERSNNPVVHQCARVICMGDANHLKVLPCSPLVKYELVKVGNYLKYIKI